MRDRFSFYYQKQNKMFNDNVLVVCYHANDDDIKKYSLTGSNIVLFIKSNKLKSLCHDSVDYFNLISNSFDDDIFIRIQSECFLGMYGDSHCDCEEQRIEFIELLKNNDGIFVHLPQEAQGWGLFYKCKELELQVNGRDTNGKYIGEMSRDEAQKYLIKSNSFIDQRNYEIIYNILKELKINNKSYIVYTESDKKIKEITKLGLKATKYSKYIEQTVTSENASEYLAKILNSTHKNSKKTIDKLCDIIISRKYNDRTLDTLIDIINRIKNEPSYKIDDYTKDSLIRAYNEIICGEAKNYFLKYSAQKKRQNKFSCQVNIMIFKQILNAYKVNIFDRLCFEKVYSFFNKRNGTIKKIRTSRVIEIKNNNVPFFVNQEYNIERTIDKELNSVVEDSTSKSKLRALFENSDYEYIKVQEMITYISEGEIKVNVFIKKIPNYENYVLDVYGAENDIREFIDMLANQKKLSLLNFVNNLKLEDGDYSNYNLRFSDLELAIKEELENYNMLCEGEKKYGNRS